MNKSAKKDIAMDTSGRICNLRKCKITMFLKPATGRLRKYSSRAKRPVFRAVNDDTDILLIFPEKLKDKLGHGVTHKYCYKIETMGCLDFYLPEDTTYELRFPLSGRDHDERK